MSAAPIRATPVRAVVDLAIAAVDFVRAESQRAKRSAIGAGMLMAMSIAGAMLVFLGLAAIMGALYLALTPALMAPPPAALLTGFVTIITALIVLYISKRMSL